MTTIYHQVWMDATAARVYEAISNAEAIGTWWNQQTATETDAGPVLEHSRTHVSFEISERVSPSWFSPDRGTATMAVLDFRHSGWNENSEYLGFCSFAWGQVLQNLEQVCESQRR